MASAKGIRAGRAFVEVGIDDKIAAGLNRVAKRLRAFGASVRTIGLGISAAGTAIATPFIAAAKIFANTGSEIFDASKRTGVAAEELSALKFAAEQSGASLEALETGLRRMSKTLAAADDESKAAVKTLGKLGITVEDLQNLSPDEQFRKIGERLNGIADASKRSAAAQEIFGRGGTALIPMLEDLAAAEQEARDNGLIISTADAAAADAFGDTLSAVWRQIKMVGFQAGAAVAKGLMPFSDGTKRVLKTAIDWTKQNGKLVITIVAIGVSLAAAGVAVVVLGAVISSTAVVMAALAATIGFVLSPIGLLVIAAVALTAALVHLTGLGTVARVAFRELGRIFGETLKGMADAIKAGDLELASRIMFAGLNLVWVEGLAALKSLWIQFISELSQLDPFGFIDIDVKGRIQALAKDLADATKNLNDLKGQAAAAAAKSVFGKERGPSSDEASDALEAMKSKTSAVGIFNGAALQSLQSGSSQVWVRIAKAAEETAKNSRRFAHPGLTG